MKRVVILMLIGLATVLLALSAGAAYQDTDGDLVPDQLDQYPGRDDKKYGGTMIIGTTDEPQTMDTLRTSHGAFPHMYISEPPIGFTPLGGLQVKMGWIESYEWAPDEKKIVFHLRPGVAFHDGVVLDAEAFATILRNRKTDPLMCETAYVNIPLENIQVLDEYTVSLEMTKWTPGFMDRLCSESWNGGMGTPNAPERYGEEYGSTIAYGNGPFLMGEWVMGDHITFVRNEDYAWAPGFAANPGPVYMEKVIIKFIPEDISQVMMLEAGEIDVLRKVPESHAERVLQLNGLNFTQRSRSELYYIEFNTKKEPLSDLKVRQALNYALDREAIVSSIFYDLAEPAYNFYCDTTLEHPGAVRMYAYDLDKARALLEEAGWVDTDGDGIREKDGKKLEFELATRLAENVKKLGIIAQAQWREIGVNAIVSHSDYNALRSQINEGNHEAVVWLHAWPHLAGMVDWWFDPNKWPYPFMPGLETPEIFEIYDAVKAATANQEFAKQCGRLVDYVTEMAIGAPIVHTMTLMAFSDDFVNIVPRTHANRIMPYMYDVYSKKVYEENLAYWTKWWEENQ